MILWNERNREIDAAERYGDFHRHMRRLDLLMRWYIVVCLSASAVLGMLYLRG